MNGLGTTEPTFGRKYIMDDKCSIGFWTQEVKNKGTLQTMLNGKGIQIQGSHSHEEGLWIPEDTSNVNKQEDIEDFHENK